MSKITRKQIGGVHVSEAIEAGKVEIQAGCSSSSLTRDQIVSLIAALELTVAEIDKPREG